jgi:hypothetical protein
MWDETLTTILAATNSRRAFFPHQVDSIQQKLVLFSCLEEARRAPSKTHVDSFSWKVSMFIDTDSGVRFASRAASSSRQSSTYSASGNAENVQRELPKRQPKRLLL